MEIITLDNLKSVKHSIKLDTALGNAIENSQILEISSFESNQFQTLVKWDQSGTRRASPTPRYNCHGLTFASRRTGIFDCEVINKILAEDGYEEIDLKQVLPGDVIIYYADDGDIEHSGVVISCLDDNLSIPLIISKWGKYAEFIHWANNCPYTFTNALYYRVMVKHESNVTG